MVSNANAGPSLAPLQERLRGMRIGYVPYDRSLQRPGDRRRFCKYAADRSLHFEIADPSERYDIVLLSAMADAGLWAEYPHGKVVYDLIDSYLIEDNWMTPLRGVAKVITGQNQRFRLDYKGAMRDLCRRADAVICSTEEQREDILSYCKNVHIILDSHETVVRATKTSYAANGPLKLAWEGLPYTLPLLATLRPVFHAISAERGVELHVVTDLKYKKYLGRFGSKDVAKEVKKIHQDSRVYEWDETTCSGILASCDLGIIPIDTSSAFATGKPENKLLLMWRIGLPVLVSPTPAYMRALARAGLDEMTCDTPEDWVEKLRRYGSNEDLRSQAGRRGQTYVNQQFSSFEFLRVWDNLLTSLIH